MTCANERTLVGIFQNRHEAEQVLDVLRKAAFDEKEIGFAIRGDDVGIIPLFKRFGLFF